MITSWVINMNCLLYCRIRQKVNSFIAGVVVYNEIITILRKDIQKRKKDGDKITLKLTERTVHGKKVKALRREGVVPAVVYGPGVEPVAVQGRPSAHR